MSSRGLWREAGPAGCVSLGFPIHTPFPPLISPPPPPLPTPAAIWRIRSWSPVFLSPFSFPTEAVLISTLVPVPFCPTTHHPSTAHTTSRLLASLCPSVRLHREPAYARHSRPTPPTYLLPRHPHRALFIVFSVQDYTMRAVFADTSPARDLTPKPEAQGPHGQAVGAHSLQSPPLQSRSHSHSHSISPRPSAGRTGSSEPFPRPSSSSDLRPPLELRTAGGGSAAGLAGSLVGWEGSEGESCVCQWFVICHGRGRCGRRESIGCWPWGPRMQMGGWREARARDVIG